MVTTAIKGRFNKNLFENEAWTDNKLIVGIDEVGRGCLAGPVVTAAVILHPNTSTNLLKDSKVLTHQELLKASTWILKNSWHSIGIIHHRDIDTHNIYQATLKAMKRSLMQLLHSCPHKPSKIVIDAMPLHLDLEPYRNLEVFHFIKGEQRSSSIAAASILAKVKRDHMMHRYNATFPGYHLGEHKGYSTSKHTSAIIKMGSCIIHRKSFLKNKTYFCPTSEPQQQSLFT